MTILSFSMDGEQSVGIFTATLAHNYTFKDIKLKSVEWIVSGQDTSDIIASGTTAVEAPTRTIPAPLALLFGFCDSKDVAHYQSKGSAETVTVGLVPFGTAQYLMAPISGDETTPHGEVQREFSDFYLRKNRPTTWAKGSDIVMTLYFRGVETDGAIADWAATTAGEFDDASYVNITLELL